MFGDDPRKVTKLLHSQTLQLADIYLNLLLSTPAFLGRSLDLPVRTSSDTLEEKLFATSEISTEAFSVLSIMNLPTNLRSGEHSLQFTNAVLPQLHSMSMELSERAWGRLTETGQHCKGDRVEPMNLGMRKMKAALLAENFVIEV